MALRQLLNRSCNSPDAVFRTIRDFLAAANGIDDFTPAGDNPGPGYEIVDASYASGDPTNTTTNDWCVLKSNGEANTYPHYLHLKFGSLYHQLNPYLHWNTETHTGMGGMSYSNVYHNGAGQVLLFLHADLDEAHIVIKPQGQANYYYWHGYGRLKPDHLAYSGAAAQAPGAIQAGTDVTITLDSWPDWAANGRKIYNWDSLGLHELTITATDQANRAITVQTAFAKAAGSWLAEDLLLFASRGYNYGAAAADIFSGLPRRSGSNPLNPAAMYVNLPSTNYGSGVDSKYGERFGVAARIGCSGEYRGSLALMADSNTAPNAQAEAWTNVTGEAWRVYTVYNNRSIILREAI